VIVMTTHERQARVHRHIELGELPDRREGIRLWAGAGSRRPCRICAEPIGAGAVECELDIAGRTIVLCVPCYLAWRAEPPGA
jgi:hypothetical protein